jgi:hypothetical protein
MTILEIHPMLHHLGEIEVLEFNTWLDAYQMFASLCDKYNIDYEYRHEANIMAGGIGYDYRLILKTI